MHKNNGSEKDRINKIYNSYLQNKKITEKWSNKNNGNRIISDQRRSLTIKLLDEKKINLDEIKILDLGCASGNLISLLISLGAKSKNIYGIDIRSSSIKNAKKRYPQIKFDLMDARELKYDKNTFDCIFIFTLLSSVLDQVNRKKIIDDAIRVLKPSGFIIYYDLKYNNPFNKNVIGIKQKELRNLFPGMKIKYKILTLIPLIARRLGKATNYLYPLLSKISFLNSHYICLIEKK